MAETPATGRSDESEVDDVCRSFGMNWKRYWEELSEIGRNNTSWLQRGLESLHVIVNWEMRIIMLWYLEIAKKLYVLNVFNCKFVVIKKWYIVWNRRIWCLELGMIRIHLEAHSTVRERYVGNLKTVLFSVMDLNKYIAHKLEDSRF